MPWVTRLLRGDRVWVKSTPSGQLAQSPDGRVEIRYQKGGKSYRASSRNLSVDPTPETATDSEIGDSPVKSAEPHKAVGRTVRVAAVPDDTVIVYTDGACTGNPGPMGIGAVIIDGKDRREISEYLGEGTNNIAELTAILRALENCPIDRTVILHSDSSYALGLLGAGWKAKANKELVEKLRAVANKFSDLRLVKVAGHAGVPENERCDELAGMAIVKGR